MNRVLNHERHPFPEVWTIGRRNVVAMKVRGGRTLTLATVGALAASLLAVGGVATASSAASEVHACVHKKTRYARIVNPTAKCRKTEERILIGAGESTTSIPTGQQGERGPQGQQGPTGTTGPMGPRGKQGVQGVQGPKGETGPQGLKGEQGLPGKEGKDGLPGKDGKDGLPGKDGEKGDRGPAGPAGPEGKQGPKGEPGSGGDYSTYRMTGVMDRPGAAEVSCLDDDQVTGGGYAFARFANAVVSKSAAQTNRNAWLITVTTVVPGVHTEAAGNIYVMCLKKG